MATDGGSDNCFSWAFIIIVIVLALVYFHLTRDGASEKVVDVSANFTQPSVQTGTMAPAAGSADVASGKKIPTETASTQSQPIQRAVILPSWRHSDDFRTVIAFSKSFALTTYQSLAIQKLWEAFKNGIPELHQDRILEGIGCCSKRLRDVFKSNMEAYRVLVVHGERKGTFRLNVG